MCRMLISTSHTLFPAEVEDPTSTAANLPEPSSELPQPSPISNMRVSTRSSTRAATKSKIPVPREKIRLGTGHLQIVTPVPYTTLSGRTSKPTDSRILALVETGVEPNTYKQALKRPDAEQWQAAVNAELTSLEENKVWEYGIDYNETFAPVVKIKSLKILLTVAAMFNLELKQLDFDTAFLNASLSEEVYMIPPDGLQYDDPTKVLKLKKALYGLKQAPREWNQDVHKLIISLGYIQLKTDTCVYIKRVTGNRLIILCLYVDDTVVAYKKEDEAIWLTDKERIASTYQIKDLGDCNWILNMSVDRDREAGTIKLSQEAYIRRILDTFNMKECKGADNPEMSTDLYHPPDQSDLTPLDANQLTIYRSIVGSLAYAAINTRLDIAHITNELARFQSKATQYHLKAAKYVLRYLKTTSSLGLLFTRHSDVTAPIIEIFSDASWGNDTETRRSTTGIVLKLNGNVICWKTKKQTTVALSSTEAEYMALSDATGEALWFRSWIQEVFNLSPQTTLYVDNQSAIILAENDTFHQRTKHIDIRYHFVRERVASGDIVVKWVSTVEQQADLLTKQLPTKQFQVLRDILMVTT
jgi:hypothetical protein